MNLEVQIIDAAPELERLAPAWQDLWQGARRATIFQSPDWLVPWWRHFAPGRLLCVALWRGKDLVGFAPLYRDEDGRRCLPLGISLSDYLDVLVAEENADSILEAMQTEIARISDRAEICFPDVAADASVLALNSSAFSFHKYPGQRAPELVLGPADNPLKNAPAHQRQNLRTAENRAGRRGCVVREIVTHELPRVVPALMQFHSARQRQLGRLGLDQDARVLPFLIEVFGALAQENVVRAYSTECEGRLVAGYLGFLHRNRASYYFGGFDPAFAFESPGTILIGHAMRCAAGEGAEIFDFLRGAEPYKYAWGARDRQLWSLSFMPGRAGVRLAS
jgi:CelD/BcsL family acetyltransferase involved in cellulose biosynthesis